jgi:hypothetical protein
MKDALLNGTVLNQNVTLTPVEAYTLTTDDLMFCEADWSKMRDKLIEKGAPAEKLDNGEYSAEQVEGGLRVEIIYGR